MYNKVKSKSICKSIISNDGYERAPMTHQQCERLNTNEIHYIFVNGVAEILTIRKVGKRWFLYKIHTTFISLPFGVEGWHISRKMSTEENIA